MGTKQFYFVQLLLAALILQVAPVSAQDSIVRPGFTELFDHSTQLSRFSVDGEVRLFSIYRSMIDSYDDQETNDKNLAFTSYPGVNNFVSNNAGIPMIDIKLRAAPVNGFGFTVGYALSHNFNGAFSDSSKTVTVRSDLNFDGTLNTDFGQFQLMAGGGVLWNSLSPFTLSQNEFKDDYFDRLPWDWNTNSFQKYNTYYDSYKNIGSENFGNAATQGFALKGSGLPLDLGFSLIYGRSSSSVSLDKALSMHPYNLLAGRVYKQVGVSTLGLNAYNHFGDTDLSRRIKDQRAIYTGDIRLDNGSFKVYTELGAGMVQNPSQDLKWGEAINVELDLKDRVVGFPIHFQYYRVAHEVANLESGIMNSNTTVRVGGYTTDQTYNSTLFVNALQEIGQMANNRQGVVLKTDGSLGALKYKVGLSVSQELNNIYDTITIQHRINAFSRSRFVPWLQNAGPYKRLKNIWRRSYEVIAIHDADKDNKKGYNALDLYLKYKGKFLNHSFIAIAYSNFNSAQEQIKPIPEFSDAALVRTFYQELNAFYQLTDQYTLVLYGGIERVLGNSKTDLSPENAQPIDQIGRGLGVGLDIDFGDYAGVYLRHRYMDHRDKNFINDKFKGHESTIELKVFF